MTDRRTIDPSAIADLRWLQRRLGFVQGYAQRLPWANTTSWTVSEQMRVERGRVVIDLHGLTTKLAQVAVEAVLTARYSYVGRGVVFVTGRGNNSPGGVPRVAHAVEETLTSYGVPQDHWDTAHVGCIGLWFR